MRDKIKQSPNQKTFYRRNEMKKFTRDQMITKILNWIKNLEIADQTFMKECGLDPEVHGNDYKSFKIEKVDGPDGRPAFNFLHDSLINDIINGYREDGFMKKDGMAFEALTEGTGWIHEPDTSCVEFFVLDL